MKDIDIRLVFIIMKAMYYLFFYFNFFNKNGSGVYRLKTINYEFNAYCNMEIGYNGFTSKNL